MKKLDWLAIKNLIHDFPHWSESYSAERNKKSVICENDIERVITFDLNSIYNKWTCLIYAHIHRSQHEVIYKWFLQFLPLSPPSWTGIVVTVRVGGQPGGLLPDLRNPYLCNRLTYFLRSKFCGIILLRSCALLWSFAHLPHMGLPMGQKLVKFATNWVQTLRNAYLWNHWMIYPI